MTEIKPVEPKEIKKVNNDHEEELEGLLTSLGNPNQAAFDAILSEKNRKVKLGNSIIHKSRVISGNYNRVAILFGFLEKLGLDCSDERNDIFGATIGFSPELSPNGMRGEIVELVRPQPQKKDPNAEANNALPNNQSSQNNQQVQTQ